MEKKNLTIFTPTYNRAYILPKLYKSLVNQTDKNFVWLIVDDGSSDETRNLVQKFLTENQIEIQYIYQENKGKHFAVNNGLKNTKTDFFTVIDSDDFLTENAVEKMEILAEEIENQDHIAGFSFIRFSEKAIFNKDDYGHKKWISGDADYIWKIPGEMTYCFKTKIHKQFMFPEFDGEKFFPESLVFRRIERKFRILITDNVLSYGDYLEDGLMNNYYELLIKNPKSSLLNIKERFLDDLSEKEKMDLAKNYWDIACKSQSPFIEKFFGISPFLILKVLINKYTK